jgi:hypothetical protein
MTYMFVNQGQKNAYLSPMPSTRRARAHMMMLMLMAMAMVMASRYGADRGYKFHSTSYVKHLYGDIMGESASWANYHIAVVKRKEEEPTINNVYAQARPYDPSISGRRHNHLHHHHNHHLQHHRTHLVWISRVQEPGQVAVG